MCSQRAEFARSSDTDISAQREGRNGKTANGLDRNAVIVFVCLCVCVCVCVCVCPCNFVSLLSVEPLSYHILALSICLFVR